MASPKPGLARPKSLTTLHEVANKVTASAVQVSSRLNDSDEEFANFKLRRRSTVVKISPNHLTVAKQRRPRGLVLNRKPGSRTSTHTIDSRGEHAPLHLVVPKMCDASNIVPLRKSYESASHHSGLGFIIEADKTEDLDRKDTLDDYPQVNSTEDINRNTRDQRIGVDDLQSETEM